MAIITGTSGDDREPNELFGRAHAWAAGAEDDRVGGSRSRAAARYG